MLKNFFANFKVNFLYPLIGFIVTMSLVIVLCIYFASNLIVQSKQKFDTKTSDVTETVKNNFNIYVNFLKDVQGLFASSNSVERNEFSTFIDNVDFVNRYPGITTIAFSKKVSKDEKQSFLDGLNNDPLLFAKGSQKYVTNPDTGKDTYFLLDFAEPYDENTQFGFDSASSDARLPNIMKAIDTNTPIMTESIALTGRNAGQYGFSIYLPVYKPDSAVDTVEDREANTNGVILGSFRLNNVFTKIFEGQDLFQNLSLKIFTDGKEDESLKLFDSNVAITSQQKLEMTDNTTIAGREWNLKFTAANGYGLSDTEKSVPFLTFIAGLIFSILVAIFLYYLRKSQSQALALASSFKVKLDESEARMNSILESVDIIAYAINPDGIFTLSSGKGLEDLGLKQHDLEGKSVFEVYKDNPVVVDQIKRALKGEVIKETVKVGDITLESRITPILGSNGKVISIVGISHNITDTQVASEKLKAKTDELERLNKMMINRELKMKELKDQLAKQS